MADGGLTLSPALWAKFAERKAELLTAAESFVANGGADDAESAALCGLLHKFAGSAGLFGQATLGSQASALEDALPQASAESRATLLGDFIAALRTPAE
jgi:hypothetical protein